MPAPTPGLNLVPRWRTMISPPVTTWPAKTFTPRCCGFESRPLRLEPRPFLCAMRSPSLFLLGRAGNRGDTDPRQLLTVTRAPLVAALRLELEDAELRPAQVLDDLDLDEGGGKAGALEDRIAVTGEQQRRELDGGADVVGQTLDQEGLALDDGVLLTAGLDDCVGHFSVGSVGEIGVGLCLRARTAPSTPAATAPRRRG